MRNLSLCLFVTIMLAAPLVTDAQNVQPTLVVVCDGGSTKGSRTDIGPDGFETGEDRVSLEKIIYAFDTPTDGAVRITYGSKEVVGMVLKNYPTFRTVVYIFGGVPLMDTIFLKYNKVLSTEHKELFGYGSATTWRLECSTASD